MNGEPGLKLVGTRPASIFGWPRDRIQIFPQGRVGPDAPSGTAGDRMPYLPDGPAPPVCCDPVPQGCGPRRGHSTAYPGTDFRNDATVPPPAQTGKGHPFLAR